MKNKTFLIFAGIIGLIGMSIVYSVVTTNLLLYNLKNRGILSSDIQYKFALASLDSRSITLYHVTSRKLDHGFIYKVQLTPIANGFSGQIQNIHINMPKIVLSLYGGSLPEKLINYQPATKFIQEWPISAALFNLFLPQSNLRFNVQKLQTQIYQINLQVQTQQESLFSASALIDTQNESFYIKQATTTIHSPLFLKQLQEYAESKKQALPQARMTTSTQKNESKKVTPNSLKLSNSK